MHLTIKNARTCVRNAPAFAAVMALFLLLAIPAHCTPQCGSFRYDCQRTGRTTFPATFDPVFVWQYSPGINSGVTPVVGEHGTVYFGALDKHFYAITGTGALAWRFRIFSPVAGSAAIGPDGTIYFATHSGKLYALNSDGTTKWDRSYGLGPLGATASVLLGGDGVIYFGAENGNLYAVDVDGAFKWGYAAAGAVSQAVAMSPDGSTIYASCADGRVYAVRSDGTLRWKSAVISPATGCGVGDDGSIYVGGTDGTFYAFNPDGTLRWTFRAGSKITSAPALGRDGVVYFGSQDSNLYAVNPDGSLKWRRSSGAAVYSAPIVDAQGTLLFGTWTGDLVALSQTDGSVLWTRGIGPRIYTSPVVGHDEDLGTVYVLDSSGVLTKFAGPVTPEPSSMLALAAALAAIPLARRRSRRR